MQKVFGTLVYVCIPKPVKAYVDPKAPNVVKPDEWKAGVVLVDQDKVDELEEYAESVGARISLKKVKTADFETKFKIPAPEGAGKNVWVLTLRKSTKMGKTDQDVPEQYRPRVFEQVGSKAVEITNTKLVANGSKGFVSIEKFERRDGTSSLYLKNVLVTSLIEYKGGTSDYVPGSEFDDEVEAPEPEKVVAEKPKAQAVKPSKKDEVPDDDIPF